VASDLLVKRLLRQAGASVLAGLLVSSAVLAEDTASDAGVSVGMGSPDVSIDPVPDVSIDPVDPGLDDGGDLGVQRLRIVK
jgi:hypothetical protein